ncbi:MAG: hypothetical protein ABEH40_00515 [Haloferacaceae archaeon]
MIEEAKQERLDEFADAIEAETGYEVVQSEPKLSRTITEKVGDQADDLVGFLVVRAPVEFKGVEFEGEVVVNVHEDHLSDQGVDVYSEPDDPLPREKRDLLDTLVPPRDETTEDGETRRVWSYYSPPADLPDGVVDDSRDNLDELIAELEGIYAAVEAE